MTSSIDKMQTLISESIVDKMSVEKTLVN